MALLFLPKRFTFVSKRELRNIDPPAVLKKVCTYVLTAKNRPEWKEDYRKIIRYFNGVKQRGISTDWAKATAASEWTYYIDRLRRKNQKVLPSTWDYIHSLDNDIPSLDNNIQSESELFGLF